MNIILSRLLAVGSCQFQAKLTLVLLSFCAPTALASAEFTDLVNERLSYMRDVAAYKWLKQLPIEDLKRESVVIASATRSGLDHNITVASSAEFFTVQIHAAKEIQQYWFTHWQQHGDPEPPADLVKVIRPALLELGQQITAGLRHAPELQTANIQVEGLSQSTINQLALAASNIKRYDNTLDQVLDSGLLRVGTTYDYQPFSYLEPATAGVEGAKGIDIDLAHDLARSLGVELEFVATSWPTLMTDHAARRFDIGMSGISINLSRQRSAFFSLPYHTGGKAAIARCRMTAQLSSLERIDQPNVRLIVNPGGTNERFVREHIRKAPITLHPDNKTIFTEIIEGRADVMITDAIEVRVKTNRHETLCATLGDKTLSFQQKGYLLPRDPVWKAYVDAWLELRRGDKTLKRAFTRHQAD